MKIWIWKPGDRLKAGQFRIRRRFTIQRRLGEGGFGITYLAQDTKPNRKVVIKTLNATQQSNSNFLKIQEDFIKEGTILKEFNHPNIVKVFEITKIGNLFGLILEYIKGQNLGEHIIKNGRLNEKQALKYIDQIAQALHYIHERNFFHRDVKPENIMLRADRESAILIDFGIARQFVDQSTIYLSNTFGTQIYKPLEQYEQRGRFGPYTDIYALSFTLYYLLTGILPTEAYTSKSRKSFYDKGTGEEIDKYLWNELIKADISEKTIIAIKSGLKVEPTDRPQNINAFRKLLGYEQDLSSYKKIVTRLETTGDFHSTSRLNKETTQKTKAGLYTRTIIIRILGAVQNILQDIASLISSTDSVTALSLPLMSRRVMLQLLLGVGGLTGIGLISLLIKIFSRSIDSLSTVSPKSSVPIPEPSISIESSPQTNPETIIAAKASSQPTLETIQFATVKLDDKGKIIARPKRTAQVYKEDLGNGVNLTMVKIPAGTFKMGISYREIEFERRQRNHSSEGLMNLKENSYSSPEHRVSIKNFYMGQTEITRAQYNELMISPPDRGKYDNFPVTKIDWNEAHRFCLKLSKKTGRIYGLPSESQWEYACRAGTITNFAFGNIITHEISNYVKSSSGNEKEVGSFPPNSFGLYDMHGNVLEWCEDNWHDNYKNAPIDGSPWVDKDIGYNSIGVKRGGSYRDSMDDAASSFRSPWRQNVSITHLGFRVVHLGIL
jgi:eukaryotic-like serine/threonine-protein kinase